MLIDCLAGVPVDSSGAFAGCERMPAALRAAGLVSRLGVPDLGNLQVALADPVRDPATGIIGFSSLVAASAVIRAATGEMLRAGRRPLLVGGCCSVLIGIAAALGDTAPGAGLAFIDGHLDCYTGITSPSGEAADMELAIILGAGPPALTGGRRLISPEAVILLGARDQEEAEQKGAAVPPAIAARLRQISCEQILAQGPAAAGRAAADYLGALPGFWAHLDLDVLSTGALPAVDYPQPGGLDWDQLRDLLRPLTTAPGFRGMDVTILNPTKDRDGTGARQVVDLLGDVLA